VVIEVGRVTPGLGKSGERPLLVDRMRFLPVTAIVPANPDLAAVRRASHHEHKLGVDPQAVRTGCAMEAKPVPPLPNHRIGRNAVATILHAFDHSDEPAAQKYLGFQQLLIPDYWEEPSCSTSTSGSGRHLLGTKWVPRNRCSSPGEAKNPL
jgi:hypothetical protein